MDDIGDDIDEGDAKLLFALFDLPYFFTLSFAGSSAVTLCPQGSC